MRVVAQRVREASVWIAGNEVAAIGAGLLLLVGIEAADTREDLEWMAQKLVKLRLFPDEAGLMNRSILEVGGDVLAVSQFTLFASYRKGNRPSWSRAAPRHISAPMFAEFVRRLETVLGKPVPTGMFGAEMEVKLVNAGPVTLLIDSKSPE